MPQLHEGNARILVAPAWRLGRNIVDLTQAKQFIAAQFKANPDDVLALGAAYFPSAGITPERVRPFVLRVSESPTDLPYVFVSLVELREHIHRLRDGHLLVAAMRLTHALGLWDLPSE